MAKILLVEDDNNLREIYEARLQAEGYDIITAHDGEEALVVAKREKPDLIISDVMMPKISGFEMLDILRNTDGLKDVKIIMLTALGQSDDQQRADRLGANRYLVKSQVTLEDIVTVAQGLLATDGEPAPAVAVEPVAPAPQVAPVQPPAAVAPSPVIPLSNPVTVDPLPVSTAPPAPIVLPVEATLVPLPAPAVPQITPETTSTVDPISPPVVSGTAAEGLQPAPLAAQLIAEEEASVEAQIEDFVQGATTEASPVNNVAMPAMPASETITALPAGPIGITPPAAPNSLAAGEATPTIVDPANIPAPEPSTNEDVVADDKLLSDALTTFSDNAAANEPKPALPPSQAPLPGSAPAITVSPGLAPLPAPDEPSIPIDGIAPQHEAPAPDSNAQAIVARKKVISPLNSTAKPDLTALLAREAANEARPDTIITPTPVVPTAPNSSQPPVIDPNSIAL
ncbi:MAG: response regulator [Candidatus Saccharibacteria bacterium]